MPIQIGHAFTRSFIIDAIIAEATRVGFNVIPMDELRRRIEKWDDNKINNFLERWWPDEDE